MWSLPLQWRNAPLVGLLDGRPLLRPEHVLLDVAVACLDEAFGEIGRLVQMPRGPTASVIRDRLLRRETHDSTVIGQGIALPHAQVPGLRAPVVAYLRLAHAIVCGTGRNTQVRHLVALVVPKPAAVPHFELLSQLRHQLRSPSLPQRLDDCRVPKQVCRLFEAAELPGA